MSKFERFVWEYMCSDCSCSLFRKHHKVSAVETPANSGAERRGNPKGHIISSESHAFSVVSLIGTSKPPCFISLHPYVLPSVHVNSGTNRHLLEIPCHMAENKNRGYRGGNNLSKHIHHLLLLVITMPNES